MVKLTIDHKTVEVRPETTILQAAVQAGLRIPTLCYLEGINEVGACRVCVVELKGTEKLVTACNTVVQEGMEVLTSTPRVRHARRMAVEFMLTEHECNCPTCPRNGSCQLQSLANSLGLRDIRFNKAVPPGRKDESSPSITRDPKKCILCYRCVSVCDKVQSLGVWRIAGTGARTGIQASFGKNLADTDCAFCGQCVVHCPVGALSIKSDVNKAWDAIADPDKITVVQIAPAVRAAWGEPLGLPREKATLKRLVATLRHLGFDYIFDTCFSADLTIMEEGTELVGRLTDEKPEAPLPLFTSCCPGWIRFVKGQYPELLPHLSSAKSPQQMFGAVAKTYYANILGVDPNRIFVVSVMPCTAKKYEAGLEVMRSAAAGQDVDIVLTTRELCAMVKEEGVLVETLDEEEFDQPLGVSTGAGVIFGATGGVMEAALRSAYFLVTGENPDPEAFAEVRGLDGWKEATFKLPGKELRCAVVNGLRNTKNLIEALKQGKVQYDFIEVMACPGGCAGGGGQPVVLDDCVPTDERSDVLYRLDEEATLRFSHENPAITAVYADFLGKPGSALAHRLLHTDQKEWAMPGAAEVMTTRRHAKIAD